MSGAGDAGQATSRGRRAGHWLGALLLALLVSAGSGCGISLRAETHGSEIFTGLTIEGDATPGAALSLVLEYEQPYPVAIEVTCDLLKVPDEEEQEALDKTAESEQSAEGESEDDEVKSRDDDPNRLFRILRESIPANPQGGPLDEATPVADTLERSFTAPVRPGDYVVVCFTREDEDNAVGEALTVEPATPSPAP